ncbi:MAG: serine/threonine protein kinase [Planctomycetes bacterium]|nr:serine/threonine protein kinase [Planctomycetota bacterium]
MSSEDEILDELVFQVLERRDSGDFAALEELCSAHPPRAEALRRRVSTLEASGMLGSSRDLPEQLGEFRILRRLGQGGMGIVFLGEQPALQRRVALKMVRPEQLYFRGARERFQREVEAIARLSHPAIVPIFTVGEAAGVPYYAMELIEGAALSEVLARLRGRDPAQLRGADLHAAIVGVCRERGFEADAAAPSDPLFAGSWADACAWLAREIAQALEHAHQRGVLHRDVKPSNVLLSPAGRVLLTDFGLASTRDGQRITGHGAQLGSLAYMAPEQLTAKADEIGARTDVFGLGATFYEALTLQLPFAADATSTSSLHSARRALPPRKHNSALLSDFELVCETALENDPRRRYATAAHFARDLSNLLQRRPIEARPPGVVLTLRRWSQRAPAQATAVLLGLVGAVLVPSMYAYQEVRAGERVAAERDVARAHLDAALEAIDSLLEKVAHRDLRDIPRVDTVKRELLERARALYERIDSGATGDPRAEQRSARTLGKLARLRRETGDIPGALADFAEAERRFRALLAARPEDASLLLEFGNLLTFATLTRFPSPTPEALSALTESVTALRRATELAPEDWVAKHELTRSLLGLGHFQDASDRDDEALASWKEASALAQGLLEHERDSQDALELWANAHGRISGELYAKGERAESERMFLELLERTRGEAAPSAYMRQLRAVAQQMLVRGRSEHEGQARDRSIDELLEGAHADFAALAADYPRTDTYLSSLALSWMDRGDRARKFGELETMQTCFDAAVLAFEELARRVPNDSRFPRSLGLIAHRRADVEREQGRSAEAYALVEDALAHLRSAWSLAQRDSYRSDLLAAYHARIELARELGRDEDLAEAARHLVEFERDAFAARFDLAQSLRLARELALRDGAAERAQAYTQELREALEAALALDSSRRARVGEALDEWGLSELEEFAELRERARQDP